jgi:hypothetical protein
LATFVSLRAPVGENYVSPVTPSEPNNHIREYLEKLGKMENCPPEGIIDANGKRSYGKYCFQRETLIEGIKKLNLYPHAEPQELDNFLADEWTQEQIILSWIKENPNLLKKHFYTTVVKRGLGLP